MTNYIQAFIAKHFTHFFRDEGHLFFLIEKHWLHIEKSAGSFHIWVGPRGLHVFYGGPWALERDRSSSWRA